MHATVEFPLLLLCAAGAAMPPCMMLPALGARSARQQVGGQRLLDAREAVKGVGGGVKGRPWEEL